MKKLMTVVLSLALMGMMVSCEDPDPGEISVKTLKNGKPQNCTVELWTAGASGKQIMEAAGENALTYLTNVIPNDYILKFRAYDKTYYEAQYAITLPNNGSEFAEVELTEADGIKKTD